MGIQKAQQEVDKWIQAHGVRYFNELTNMAQLTEEVGEVSDALDIPVIASGGVGDLEHLAEGVLQGHADAVLAASIFHYGEYTVRQAKEYMREQGIEVRL